MQFRRIVNEKPRSVIAIAALALCLVVVLIWRHFSAQTSIQPRGKAFFTIDDGKTWFAADVTCIPPFDHDGSKACRAIVISCGDGKPFVHHLESYPPKVKEQLHHAVEEASDSSQKIVTALRGEEMMSSELLVKKPGDPTWLQSTPKDAEAYRNISTPSCPDGQDIVTVNP